jgi:hypothetical protein
VEPLLDKFASFSPYIYSQSNPIRLIDENGKGPRDGQQYTWFTSTNDIKLSANDIGERISLGYEKLFKGDFSGALNQFIDNAKNSYRILELIPRNPLTDFITPLGLVQKTPKLLELSVDLSLKENAAKISQAIGGKSRISLGYGELDLIGSSHFSKLFGKEIPTPHLTPIIFQYAPGKGFFSKVLNQATREATMDDLQRAVQIINSKF